MNSNRKGLNREIIIEKAAHIVLEKQTPEISLLEISKSLGVKSPSLYNYIDNIEDVKEGVKDYASKLFIKYLNDSIVSVDKDENVKNLSRAYRTFAKSNIGLYKILLLLPANNEETNRHRDITSPIFKVLIPYNLEDTKLMNMQRMLRSLLNGYTVLDSFGLFYDDKVLPQKSFDDAIESFIQLLYAN